MSYFLNITQPYWKPSIRNGEGPNINLSLSCIYCNSCINIQYQEKYESNWLRPKQSFSIRGLYILRNYEKQLASRAYTKTDDEHIRWSCHETLEKAQPAPRIGILLERAVIAACYSHARIWRPSLRRYSLHQRIHIIISEIKYDPASGSQSTDDIDVIWPHPMCIHKLVCKDSNLLDMLLFIW